MNNNYNIEELFKGTFEGYEVQPSDGAWTKIQRAFNRRQFMHFNPRRLNIYYTLGAILVSTAVAIILLTKNHNTLAQPETTNTPIQSQLSHSETNIQSQTQQQPRNYKESGSRVADIKSPLPPATRNPQPATKHEDIIDSIEYIYSNTAPAEPNLSGPVSTMVTYFIPSVREGCAPLTVKFTNLSTNAKEYVWSLGPNQPAIRNPQPETVYTEPGNYIITLSATDRNNLTLTHTETITVHPTPKADFEITDSYIYNYSSDAKTYKWLLIDKDSIEVSSDFQMPLSEALKDQQPATSKQQLALIVTNIHNCSDTITKTLPEPSSPSLAFPSAFSPNPGGPTGGYYSPNAVNNNVFHPTFNEEPLEYSLKIYSKSGQLIFESNDIHIGWDGYYNQTLIKKGVYIYKVIGIWKDSKPFKYSGDITILLTEN